VSNLKKTTVLDGQIDLFSLTIQEPITKPKEKVIIEKQEMEKDTFINIINLYKESCSRIVKTVSGALLVELEDKTKYFNGQGIHEFDLGIDIGLMPSDEIIIVNKEKCFNDIQMEKLKGINPTKYIKRKGDANLIIPLHDKTIVINPRGWVIEWKQKPIYKDNEVAAPFRASSSRPQMAGSRSTTTMARSTQGRRTAPSSSPAPGPSSDSPHRTAGSARRSDRSTPTPWRPRRTGPSGSSSTPR
jgi:hypothetical protein